MSFYRWTQWIFLQIFNSWYDEELDRARPIAELIEELESGRIDPVDAETNPGGGKWQDLNEQERAAIVNGRRMAYVSEIPVSWCPGLGTVLANEEVTAEGRSERGNMPVYKRPLRQWMMRITSYCERLLDDLADLDWPEPIKLMQRNWIGRSEGAEVDFLGIDPAGGQAGIGGQFPLGCAFGDLPGTQTPVCGGCCPAGDHHRPGEVVDLSDAGG